MKLRPTQIFGSLTAAFLIPAHAGRLCWMLRRGGEVWGGSAPLSFLSHLPSLSSSFYCSSKVRNTQVLNKVQLFSSVLFIPILPRVPEAPTCLAGEKFTFPTWMCLWTHGSKLPPWAHLGAPGPRLTRGVQTHTDAEEGAVLLTKQTPPKPQNRLNKGKLGLK